MPATRLHATLAALITLAPAACTSTRDAMIARGVDPAYAQGYDDGCSSGSEAGGGLFGAPSKDATRYATDRHYTQGWDAGFAKCERDAQAMVLDARTRNLNRDK